MAGGGEEGDELLAQEHRRHHHVVKQVPGAEPRVIGDEHVAGLHGGLREVPEEMPDGSGHGVDVARRAGHRLGDHVAGWIRDSGGKIARLTRDGAEGGAQQRLGLFFHHRDEAVPHDLGANGGECILAHRRRSRTMYPSELTAAVKLAPTMVDVSSSAMMAGPLMAEPGFMSKRQ